MTTSTDTAQARAQLVAQLRSKGALHTPSLIAAFTAIPREVFVPSFLIRRGLGYLQADQALDRTAWLAQVYRDKTLITAIDAGGTAVSSSSTPSVMAVMLEALAIPPTGETRVWELGTGTGYNAALLCYLVEDTSLTSIDIDDALVEQARARLASIGYRPQLSVGTPVGTTQPGRAFDRVILTFGVHRLPNSVTSHIAPGGVVVANIGRGLAALHANTDASRLVGRFQAESIAFMRERTDPTLPLPNAREAARLILQPPERTHRLHAASPRDIDDAWWLAQLLLHDVMRIPTTELEGRLIFGLVDHASGSWARADLTDPTRALVRSAGSRCLWDEFADAVTWWQDAGRPSLGQAGLTITAEGHHTVWIEDPGDPRRRALG